MGNSCHKSRAVTWVDDDEEEDFEQDQVSKRNDHEKRKNKISKDDQHSSSSSSTTVKIKITKRQLEEILRLSSKRDQLPMELVLSSFMNSNNTDIFLSDNTSKWRPKLQTIEEQDDEQYYL